MIPDYVCVEVRSGLHAEAVSPWGEDRTASGLAQLIDISSRERSPSGLFRDELQSQPMIA